MEKKNKELQLTSGEYLVNLEEGRQILPKA